LARIFISHSSRDNPAAVVVKDWLESQGWDDSFLDLDPTRGIAGGERWERALYRAADRCEAVICLISRAWLDSRWCRNEFLLARRLNKRVLGVLIEDLGIQDLPAELTDSWQVVNLAAGTDHRLMQATLPGGAEAHVTFSRSGLERLKAGLLKAGLDPRVFAWPPAQDPDRPPYRGLRALEAEDAGIFFGREASIIAGLDRLRGLREAAPPRALVILGASGAGKSSFLRAGLLARLRRDDRNFLPLPPIRPERAALTGEEGLLAALEQAFRAAGLAVTRAALKQALAAGADALLPLLSRLAESARPAVGEGEDPVDAPALVIPVDQSEELFLAEGAGEGAALLDLLRRLSLAETPMVIPLLTIRSDSFEQLQSHPALEGLSLQTFSLPPLPRGAYLQVIEGPARRLAESRRPLTVDPALTERLLADLEAGGGKDALPLLAFCLERLYLEYGGDGDLRLDEYEAIGGIEGSIEAAVQEALAAAATDPAVPASREERLALLRRGLIPWLAGIDPETGSPRRRVARLAEIPEEARPLVRHLIEQRLLATDVAPESGEATVEPAHEALLRQWGLLKGWLAEDFAALNVLEGLRRAARDWEANGRDEAWLAHGGGRLDDAEALLGRADLAAMLGAGEGAYLVACRAAAEARRDRELKAARQLAAAKAKAARRTLWGAAAAVLLALAAGVAALVAVERAEEATRQQEIAEQRRLDAVASLGQAVAAKIEVARSDERPYLELALILRLVTDLELAVQQSVREDAHFRLPELIGAARQFAVAPSRVHDSSMLHGIAPPEVYDILSLGLVDGQPAILVVMKARTDEKGDYRYLERDTQPLELRDLATGRTLASFPWPTSSGYPHVSFVADSLLLLHDNGERRLFRLDPQSGLREVAALPAVKRPGEDASVSLPGSYFVAATRVWTDGEGGDRGSWSRRRPQGVFWLTDGRYVPLVLPEAEGAGAGDLQLGGFDNERLLTFAADRLLLFDPRSGALLAEHKAPLGGPVQGAGLLQDGSLWVAAAEEIAVLDAAGRVTARARHEADAVVGVTGDASLIATLDCEEGLRLLDPAALASVLSLPEALCDRAWSAELWEARPRLTPDRKAIAFVAWSGEHQEHVLWLASLAGGQPPRRLRFTYDAPLDFAFDGSGAWVVVDEQFGGGMIFVRPEIAAQLEQARASLGALADMELGALLGL
jgi:hypothetical protein